jgi:hypothetical protein
LIAAARFTAAGCLYAQRWVAPTVAYAVVLGATYAAGGGASTNLTVDAAVLFPVTAWLTVAVLNDEDDDHLAITASIVGGMRRLRLAKLALALAGGAALAIAGVVFASELAASALTVADLAAGICRDLLAILGGVALGAACARPLVRRAGTALLVISLATVADLVVPRTLAVSAVTTVVGAFILLSVSLASSSR